MSSPFDTIVHWKDWNDDNDIDNTTNGGYEICVPLTLTLELWTYEKGYTHVTNDDDHDAKAIKS